MLLEKISRLWAIQRRARTESCRVETGKINKNEPLGKVAKTVVRIKKRPNPFGFGSTISTPARRNMKRDRCPFFVYYSHKLSNSFLAPVTKTLVPPKDVDSRSPEPVEHKPIGGYQGSFRRPCSTIIPTHCYGGDPFPKIQHLKRRIDPKVLLFKQ